MEIFFVLFVVDINCRGNFGGDLFRTVDGELWEARGYNGVNYYEVTGHSGKFNFLWSEHFDIVFVLDFIEHTISSFPELL